MRVSFFQKPFTSKTIGTLLLICTGIVLIYLLWGSTVDESTHSVTLADLEGVWTSTHPRYQDRFLQFDDQSITFGWGAQGTGSYAIAAIESQPDEAGTRVHLRYQDLAQTVYQFNFYYVHKVGGLLRMKNQTGVDWFRTNDQPIHSPNFQ